MPQNQNALVQSTSLPIPKLLEAISVKIKCHSDADNATVNGTGTLFSDGQEYYVMTAAHCLCRSNGQRFEQKEVSFSFPHHENWPAFSYVEEVRFLPEDNKDFAVLKVSFRPSNDNFTQYDRIRFLNDDYANISRIYGYTKTYETGRSFKMEWQADELYSVNENITAQGKDLEGMMKGASGAGLMHQEEDYLYCVGYVKSTFDNFYYLDDVKVHKVKDLGVSGCLGSSISAFSDSSIVVVSNNNAQINYQEAWSKAYNSFTSEKKLKDGEREKLISDSIDEILKAKKEFPLPKSVYIQENVTNYLLRKNGKWTDEETRLFLLSLSDRCLWPALFGEIKQAPDDLSNKKECMPLLKRQLSLLYGIKLESELLELNTDEGKYEQIMRAAFSLDFDRMHELINTWDCSAEWLAKKALLLNMFEKDDELISSLENQLKDVEASEVIFIKTLIANLVNNDFISKHKYHKFWRSGLDSPGEFIGGMVDRIDKEKKQPHIFGVHSTAIISPQDIVSFPESLRLLQYLIDTGLTTQYGIYNVVSKEQWMKAFRHLYHLVPLPTVYYTIQYFDEKLCRWAGQIIAFNDEPSYNEKRGEVLCNLLRCLKATHFPNGFWMGIYSLSKELYCSVSEDVWYADFNASVLDMFCNVAEVKNISTSDAIYKNMSSAISCIRNLYRRREVFLALVAKMNENAHIVSSLICNSLWIDQEFVKDENVQSCINHIIDDYPIKHCYDVLYELNRVSVLSEDQRNRIDSKIVAEPMDFASRDIVALINISYLAFSDHAINKIKETVLAGDIWNCGITGSTYTDPNAYHIEMFSKNIRWSVSGWKTIAENMLKNISIIEEHDKERKASNYFNVAHMELLTEMRLFCVNIHDSEGYDIEYVTKQIDEILADRRGFDSISEAICSDDYNTVVQGLNMLNVLLKVDGFDAHIDEIAMVLSHAIMKHNVAPGRCIEFLAYMMHQYRELMIQHFSVQLILLLKNYCEYDYEALNLNVPVTNHHLSLIAFRMKPDFDEQTVLEYWISDEVVNRFGCFGELY